MPADNRACFVASALAMTTGRLSNLAHAASITAPTPAGPAVGIVPVRIIAVRLGCRSGKAWVLVAHHPYLLLLDVRGAGRRRAGPRDNGNQQQRCRKHRKHQKPDRELFHWPLLFSATPFGMPHRAEPDIPEDPNMIAVIASHGPRERADDRRREPTDADEKAGLRRRRRSPQQPCATAARG